MTFSKQAADVNSRWHFQNKNIGRIRVKLFPKIYQFGSYLDVTIKRTRQRLCESLKYYAVFSPIGKLKFKNSEYDQEIPQSQTADKSVALWGRATQQSWDIRKTKKSNQLSLPYQENCKTRMDKKQRTTKQRIQNPTTGEYHNGSNNQSTTTEPLP